MKNPWFKFYPSDWRSDPALRMCSLAARGLWMELLGIMHEAEPRGHLLIAGRPVPPEKIAALAGVSLSEVQALLAELEEAGVFSRKKNGVVFSRRMERDENKARKNQENGAKGGNPTLCNRRENEGSVNRGDKAQKPEARSQIEGLSKDSPGAAPSPELPLRSKPALIDLATAQEALDAYNAMAASAGLPKAQRLTDARRKQLAQRLKECGGITGWRMAMDQVAASDFLTGKIKNWRADLDFILQASSFTKIMEGSYANKPAPKPQNQHGWVSAQDALNDLYGGGEEDRFAV